MSSQIFKLEICTKICETCYDQKVLASTENIRKWENENYLLNKITRSFK